MTKKLSEKKYWDDVHKDNSVTTRSFFNLPIIKNIVIGFHNWELYTTCKKYIKKEYKNIFEVWCAPGNYLIQFHKLFWLHPNGIEYSKDGVDILKRNFKKNNIESNIIYGDFFDKEFLELHKEKYDITYSLWFIEHFSDPSITIENHFKITKKWWLIIIVIPNLYYLNKYFTTKEVLSIHNLNIMKLDTLKKTIKNHEILELKYFWWPFNIWQFSYKNFLWEKIRFFFFIIQRIFIDPIFMILFKLGINLSNKHTSPSIIIICRKN